MSTLSNGRDRTAPTFQGIDKTYNYAENQISNAVVANISLNNGRGFTDNRAVTGYRFVTILSKGRLLISGTTSPDKAFTIDSTGAIKITQIGANTLQFNDFETGPASTTYQVQARDAAGNWSAATPIVLKKLDVNETGPAPNTPATITGTSSAALTEDGTPSSASGSLSVSDVDTAENTFNAPAPAALSGTYGTFSFTNGAWGYTLNNADPDTQALAAGVTVTDSFLVTSFDGTASQAITVSITGANDPASITGTSSAALTEDGTPSTASGSLTVSDVDTAENTFKPVGALNGTYGNFSFNNGLWGYTLNNADPDTQALAAGVTVTDSFLVTSFDGTASQAITVSITGANDPAVITGTSSAALTETDGVLSTGGSLSISDVDTGESSFQSRSNVAGSSGLGSFNVDSTGAWTYVTNDAGAADSLSAGQTITDSVVVSSFDGSASQTISVTITGTERKIVVDSAGFAFVDSDGDGIKDNGESSATLDGNYNFADDQVTVIFTGIPTTQKKVNLSGFGSDDKVIINYAGMSNPFGLSLGQQEFANFKTLSAGWAGLIPATVATAQNNIFSLKKIVGVGQIGLNASNPNGGGKLIATFSNTAGGIGKFTRTFAIWSSQTSIPLSDPNRVSITWPTVPSTVQNLG